MCIKVGRKHGNRYHGNVYQKITVTPSEKFNDLLAYELDQLEKNGDIIYERDNLPPWIIRTCIRCFMRYMELKEGIWECSKCNLKKIP